jgi:uncharacterized protein
MRLPRLWLIIFSTILILVLMLWLINSIASFYQQVTVTTPWLAVPLLVGIGILVAMAIGLLIYYVGVFRGWWRKSPRRQPPVVPTEKPAAAAVNLEAIELQITAIEDEVTRQAMLAQSQSIAADLERGDIRVVVFGTGSAGKTSLVNAIVGEVVGEVGAAMGTTKISQTYTLTLKGLNRQILLIDTPGILEAGIAGTERESIARDLAANAELILFIVDNDLRESEYRPLMDLAAIGKRSLLVFNKTDLYLPVDRDAILAQLRSRVARIIPDRDVIAIMANPEPVRLDTGEIITPDPDISNLLKRLASVLRSAGEELVADNILLQSKTLGDRARDLLDRQRRQQAEKIVDRYQWISAGVVTITPVPVVDLLAAAAINTQMIIEIGKIYNCDLDKAAAQELAKSLGKTIASLGIIKGTIQLLTTALKVNIATYLFGKAIQGVTTAYLTRIAGRSFIEYFARDRNWGDGGISAVVREQFELSKKEEFMRLFIDAAMQRVIEPLKKTEADI